MSKSKNISFIVGSVIILAILVLGLIFRFRIGQGIEEFPISWFIIVSAILGAIVNQTLRNDELSRLEPSWMMGYILWKCTVSIVFAFALYMLFMSGLVGGDMFPDFSRTTVAEGGEYKGMAEFATQVDPVSNKDVAKIIVWSFVAGYSEKFVPNLISQLIKESSQSEMVEELS